MPPGLDAKDTILYREGEIGAWCGKTRTTEIPRPGRMRNPARSRSPFRYVELRELLTEGKGHLSGIKQIARIAIIIAVRIRGPAQQQRGHKQGRSS